MRLAEPDADGRRSPVPIPGQCHELPTDIVIVAVSQGLDDHGMQGVAGTERWLRTREDGKLAENIWAGGDDRGPGIASKAIAQGRLAAESAHAELRGLCPPPPESMRKPLPDDAVKTDYYASRPRAEISRRPRDDRLSHPDAEIEATLSYEAACDEAKRCMSCGLCFDCQLCFMYCNGSGFTRIEQPRPGPAITSPSPWTPARDAANASKCALADISRPGTPEPGRWARQTLRPSRYRRSPGH